MGSASDGDLETLAERDMLDEEFAVTFERLNRTVEEAAVSATVSEEAIETIHRIAGKIPQSNPRLSRGWHNANWDRPVFTLCGRRKRFGAKKEDTP